MINTQVGHELIREFAAAGGAGKPCLVELSVYWAKDEKSARKTAREI